MTISTEQLRALVLARSAARQQARRHQAGLARLGLAAKFAAGLAVLAGLGALLAQLAR